MTVFKMNTLRGGRSADLFPATTGHAIHLPLAVKETMEHVEERQSAWSQKLPTANCVSILVDSLPSATSHVITRAFVDIHKVCEMLP